MGQYLHAWEKQYRTGGRLWTGYYSTTWIEKRLRRNSRVLDVGCGNGKTLMPLVKKKYDVVGLDVSETALNILEETLKKSGIYIQLVLGDAVAFPFHDGCFDAVICNYVLTHLLDKDRIKAVNEIRRVLKNNGFLFMEVFSADDFRYGKGKKIEENSFLRKDGIIYHYFTYDEIKNLLKDFQILELKKIVKGRTIQGVRYNHNIISVTAQK
jgi:ubiquinone/menaquinone biosynthesis C-methylase UbiE